MVDPQSSLAEDFDKDVEVQSLHTTESDSEELRSQVGEDARPEPRFMSLTEKGDIEAYPDGVNEPQNQTYGGRHPVARTSTGSNWKDPGPPPDGGLFAWTQGEWHSIEREMLDDVRVLFSLWIE